jgi:hypothetical protein
VSSSVRVAEATSEEVVLPERVQEALGQLAGAAKEGLLALSVGVGLGVLTELTGDEVVRHEALSDRETAGGLSQQARDATSGAHGPEGAGLPL